MGGRDFVLIHGAFRGGWSMQRLSRALQALGHRTFTPTLPAVQDGQPPPDLSAYADAVCSLLAEQGLQQAVLVGHSQGGLVISAASQRCPGRIERLIFVDAPVPRHGERAVDLIPPALQGMSMPSLSSDQVLPPPPVKPGPDLSETDAHWINEQLRPEPAKVALERLVLDDPRALALPRHYLFCRHTPETYPCAHGRARLQQEGVAFGWLDAGHEVPVTAPQALAAMLHSLVTP